MSKDKKENKSEYTFIKEQILPKRKSRVKKIVVSLGSTVVLAVVFGVVAHMAYRFSGTFLDQIFGEETNKKEITFTQGTPSEQSGDQEGSEEVKDDSNDGNSSAEPSIGAKEEGEESESDKDNGKVNNYYVEKKVAADLADYMNIYNEVKKIANNAEKSVVTVVSITKDTDWTGSAYSLENETPGLIVGNNGVDLLVLVTYDRVKSADKIVIEASNGKQIKAKLMTYDKATNLAIVSIAQSHIEENTLSKLEVADLGESYSLQNGSPIIAIGAPNGLCDSMDVGIIATHSKDAYVPDGKVSLFYTNLSYNANSQGFLLNMEGSVIGIISHRFDGKENQNGINAIGITSIKKLIEQLVNDQEGIYFGVNAQDMPLEALNDADISNGVYVTEVEAKSPAYDAGIQSGDIILSMDDSPVGSMTRFMNILNDYKAKDEIKVKIKRFTNNVGKEHTLKVTLQKKNH